MKQLPVIVISSSQKGVGKTTLAYNLAGALWHDKYKVYILSPQADEFIQIRQELCQREQITLPFPQIITSLQEANKNNDEQSVVIADIPSENNQKYADIFAQAHTLVTIADKQAEINWQASDEYLNLIWQTKKEIARKGIKYLNWVVVENHLSEHAESWNNKAKNSARHYGFRLSPQLQYRLAYQHIGEGYCAADMIIPQLSKNMTMADVYARHEILKLTDFMWQKK